MPSSHSYRQTAAWSIIAIHKYPLNLHVLNTLGDTSLIGISLLASLGFDLLRGGVLGELFRVWQELGLTGDVLPEDLRDNDTLGPR